MRNLNILYLMFFFLVSCEESEESKLSRLVREWEGKEIVFPQECTFTDLDGNQCAAPLQDVPYKIVYYVDSLGCMSCKLKLEEWSKFIHEADSLSDGKVSAFFYFHPKRKNLKELRYTLETHSFDYPVCIDTLDRFNARNIFPENDSFHTFLLDASNKVAVIGNPVLSPEIKELYLQVMTGKKNDAKVQELTEISIGENVLELGTIKIGESLRRSVGIKNTGRHPLVITDVITSCDCVKSKVSASKLNPGENAVMQLDFTPDEEGEFFKEVYMYCNTADSPVGVQIHGIVSD